MVMRTNIYKKDYKSIEISTIYYNYFGRSRFKRMGLVFTFLNTPHIDLCNLRCYMALVELNFSPSLLLIYFAFIFHGKNMRSLVFSIVIGKTRQYFLG